MTIRLVGRRSVAVLLALVVVLAPRPAHALVVRFFTTLGNFNVRMFTSSMPRTTTNFMNYVTGNDYDGTFFHRSARTMVEGASVPFVVQGGGFKVPAGGLVDNNGQLSITQIPLDPPINDEPGGGVAGPSNLRGTIAMAKSGPNTATSQFFFNMRDNTGLDNPARPDGGFAAFGRVLGTGMEIVDNISELVRYNVGVPPVQEVPVRDILKVQQQLDVFSSDVILLNDIRALNIPEGDYNFNGVVNAGDVAVWKANFGSTTNLEADGNGDGRVDGLDYLIVQRTMGENTGAPVAPVPEPTALGLGALAAAALAAIRRRWLPRRARA
jgi:peptidyl-prolyl cis-trans isomerase A (cyclophilin A)